MKQISKYLFLISLPRACHLGTTPQRKKAHYRAITDDLSALQSCRIIKTFEDPLSLFFIYVWKTGTQFRGPRFVNNQEAAAYTYHDFI